MITLKDIIKERCLTVSAAERNKKQEPQKLDKQVVDIMRVLPLFDGHAEKVRVLCEILIGKDIPETKEGSVPPIFTLINPTSLGSSSSIHEKIGEPLLVWWYRPDYKECFACIRKNGTTTPNWLNTKKDEYIICDDKEIEAFFAEIPKLDLTKLDPEELAKLWQLGATNLPSQPKV
jgi:hypothetical protein